jgi:hypothetical protein
MMSVNLYCVVIRALTFCVEISEQHSEFGSTANAAMPFLMFDCDMAVPQ